MMSRWAGPGRRWLDARLLLALDVPTLALAGVLVTVGLVLIHHASYDIARGVHLGYAAKQGRWLLVAGLVLMAVVHIPMGLWSRLAPSVYGGVNLLLIMVLVGGRGAKGAVRWIDLGAFRLQPSELMKPALVLALAALLARRAHGELSRLALTALLLLLPIGLILLQPDLGTCLTFIPIALVCLYLSGVRLRVLLLPVLLGIAAIPVALPRLHGYQLKRLEVYLDPYAYKDDAGYQVVQSFETIASGGLFGAGAGEGWHTRLGFLPDRHTDFIFSVAAESWGLVGASALIGVLGLLILRGLLIAGASRDPFARMVAGGSVAILWVQLVMNAGMCIGLTPVTGLTFPFVSYGGSSLVVSALLLGLLLRVAAETRQPRLQTRR